MKLPWDDPTLELVEGLCADLLSWYSSNPNATLWKSCHFCDHFRFGPCPEEPFKFACKGCPWVVFTGMTCVKFAAKGQFASGGVTQMRRHRDPQEWVDLRCMMLKAWLLVIRNERVIRRRDDE